MTRAELLRHALSQALRKVCVADKNQNSTRGRAGKLPVRPSRSCAGAAVGRSSMTKLRCGRWRQAPALTTSAR